MPCYKSATDRKDLLNLTRAACLRMLCLEAKDTPQTGHVRSGISVEGRIRSNPQQNFSSFLEHAPSMLKSEAKHKSFFFLQNFRSLPFQQIQISEIQFNIFFLNLNIYHHSEKVRCIVQKQEKSTFSLQKTTEMVLSILAWKDRCDPTPDFHFPTSDSCFPISVFQNPTSAFRPPTPRIP